MKPDFDLIIIGAGVIGLAIALEAASKRFSVLIVEKAKSFGTEASSRNSEVIHAGIYYPQNSLKALTCVAGNHKLYEFCQRYQVPHRQCGKFIIASSDTQIEILHEIQAGAKDCGVVNLSLLKKSEVNHIEPELDCVAALYSPSTGIIDSHSYMQTMLGIACTFGAEIIYNTEVTGVVRNSGSWSICVDGQVHPVATARTLVNAAGLSAAKVGNLIEGMDRAFVPKLKYAKGSYFGYRGRVPFASLIYPVPDPGGLGVHLTLDLANQARFGPDVEWVDEIDYVVSPKNLGNFVKKVKKFWPRTEPERFYPDYSGIRPKLHGPEASFADFVIASEVDHKLPNIICLYGVESPGITASLPIAEMVVRKILQMN